MKVNGEQISLPVPTTLKKFLMEQGYEVTRIAVEKNGFIVPKDSYETETLSDRDCLEIVSFVGGG